MFACTDVSSATDRTPHSGRLAAGCTALIGMDDPAQPCMVPTADTTGEEIPTPKDSPIGARRLQRSLSTGGLWAWCVPGVSAEFRAGCLLRRAQGL